MRHHAFIDCTVLISPGPVRIVTGFAAMIAVLSGVAGCSSPPSGSPANSPSSPSRGSAAAQEVKLKTSDGWTIVGDLYTPSGTSKGAVILLHQRNGSGKDWEPLCLSLQKAGITALAIDQRGAGRSTQGPGSPGGEAPWPTSPDIAAAIESVKNRGSVGLAGASYGANNALIYAAAHPDQVKSIALFSPGADYHSLDALTPAKSWRGPLAIYHDKGDSIADTGPQQIDQATASTDHKLNLTDGSRHGTDLLPDTTDSAVAFFQRTLQ
jgi:pimeloyl-ACP methyl ester carboxylesterase